MAGSGVARARVVLSAVVVALGAVAAQGAVAGAVATGGRGPVVEAVRQMHPDAPSQQCFFTIPSCTSADPTVAFVIATNNDSTGCEFSQDTSWGDGSADTVKKYKGGPANTGLVTFTHTYATPGDVPDQLHDHGNRQPARQVFACRQRWTAVHAGAPAPAPLPVRAGHRAGDDPGSAAIG